VNRTKVILIGGPPCAGKTTLGRELAIRLGITSLTIDDLMIATRAITNPESHPDLHLMTAGDHVNYFTSNIPEILIDHADRQHRASWTAVEKVIRSHSADWGSQIVIDGWAMRPSWIADLKLGNVMSFWLKLDPSVLEERERRNTDFFGKSSDPDRMLENFLARSLWYNDLIRDEAAENGINILRQPGDRSVDDLCEEVLRIVE